MVCMKIFVPFSENLGARLMDELALNPGDLVPFQLDYECLRLGEPFRDTPVCTTSNGREEELREEELREEVQG